MQDNYIGITLCNFLAYLPFRDEEFLSHLKVSLKDPCKEYLNISRALTEAATFRPEP
jgi:hypothetical protein